jgi:REP element-mobilizing transposase RayT
LLRPDAALNQLFLYCLALGAQRYGIAVHGLCVMSNHYHLTLTDVRGVLPDFMGWLNSQLAKRIKRLRCWDEVVWEPNVPYSAVELQGEAEVLDKVAYTLLNPVSAGLVQQPEDWPGLVSTLTTLQRGRVQVERPKVGFKDNVPQSVTLSLAPPPCFRDHSQYLSALRALVASRLQALHAQWARQGRRVLGRRAVTKTSVTARPTTRKTRFGRSPKDPTEVGAGGICNKGRRRALWALRTAPSRDAHAPTRQLNVRFRSTACRGPQIKTLQTHRGTLLAHWAHSGVRITRY